MSGDYKLEDSVYILFTTRAFATGIPGVLSAATVAVYEDVTATPIETSIAVTETLNSINGLNAVTIAALAASGYNAGGHYHVVIEAGTVDSVSVVGEVVGNFSIAAGAAAQDLANGTDGLGAIKAETALIVGDTVDIQTQVGTAGAGLTNLGASGNDWNTVVPDAAGVAPTAAEIETEVWDGLQSAHVVAGSMGILASEIATIDGKIDTAQTDLDTLTAGVTLAAGAITNASLAGNMEIVFETDFATNYNTTRNAWVTNGTDFIGTGWNVAKTGYALTTADWNVGKTGYSLTATTGLGAQTANITGNVSGSVGSVTGAVGSVTGAVGSVTGHTNQTGDNFAIVNGAAGLVAIDTVVDAVKVVTDALTSAGATKLAASMLGVHSGAFEGTPSTTVMQTDLGEATDDHYIGSVLVITSGVGAGERTDVTDYTGATGTITVTAVATAPAAADTFVIV